MSGFKRSLTLIIAAELIGMSVNGCTAHLPTPEQVSGWMESCRYTAPVKVHKTVLDALDYRMSVTFQDVDIKTGQVLTERTGPTLRCDWTGHGFYKCDLTDSSYHPRHEKQYMEKDMRVGSKPSPGARYEVVRQTDFVELETGENLASSAYSYLTSTATYLGYLNSYSHRTCGGEIEDNDVFKHTKN